MPSGNLCLMSNCSIDFKWSANSHPLLKCLMLPKFLSWTLAIKSFQGIHNMILINCIFYNDILGNDSQGYTDSESSWFMVLLFSWKMWEKKMEPWSNYITSRKYCSVFYSWTLSLFGVFSYIMIITSSLIFIQPFIKIFYWPSSKLISIYISTIFQGIYSYLFNWKSFRI